MRAAVINSIKKLFRTKRFWVIVVALLVIGLWYSGQSGDELAAEIETGLVERGEVVEIVSETGVVEAAQAVDMAFLSSGRVSEVLVGEGMQVAEGDPLVRLEDSQQAADLTAAQARLKAEQARLNELLVGADKNSLAVSESSVTAAKTTVENAKENLEEVTAQQDQLVENAKEVLFTSGLQAYLVNGERENSNYAYTAPTITGTYASEEEGVYRVELYGSAAGSGSSYRVSGLEKSVSEVSTVHPTPLGDRGLYLQFPDDFAKRTTWEIPIPNTRASSYTSNRNAYQAAKEARSVAITNAENAVKAAEAALTQATSQLTQTASSARDERIIAQQAMVQQMQAAVDSAETTYNNMTLRAPFAGTITSVNSEVGGVVSPATPAVSLISLSDFELTVNVPEVDIAEVSVGDAATVTFDAYDGQQFSARVVLVTPGATLIDGVRVFAVTLAFEGDITLVRNGLSSDIDITTATRTDVIAIPTRAIYEDENGKFVRAIKDGEVVEIRVTTGLRGSNGKTEIVSGLSEGETIIMFASEEALASIE